MSKSTRSCCPRAPTSASSDAGKVMRLVCAVDRSGGVSLVNLQLVLNCLKSPFWLIFN